MSVRINTGTNAVNNLQHWVDLATMGAVKHEGDISNEVIRKFGEAVGVGTAEQDLWNAPISKETLLTSGAALFATCEDNTNGVGQVIKINGLDENWEEQEGLVTLNGQSPAAITNVDGSAALWTRVHRAFQISAEPDPVGDVWISETDTYTLGVPDTNTKVHGFIDYTDAAQQTEKGMYTVPYGHTAIVMGMTAGMRAAGGGNARSAEVFIEVQNPSNTSVITSPTWAPFRRVAEVSLFNTGQVWVQEFFTVPLRVPELTNIHMRCQATASSDITGCMYIATLPTEYLSG